MSFLHLLFILVLGNPELLDNILIPNGFVEWLSCGILDGTPNFTLRRLYLLNAKLRLWFKILLRHLTRRCV
mgnify:CR=1 FL=1